MTTVIDIAKNHVRHQIILNRIRMRIQARRHRADLRLSDYYSLKHDNDFLIKKILFWYQGWDSAMDKYL